MHKDIAQVTTPIGAHFVDYRQALKQGNTSQADNIMHQEFQLILSVKPKTIFHIAEQMYMEEKYYEALFVFRLYYEMLTESTHSVKTTEGVIRCFNKIKRTIAGLRNNGEDVQNLIYYFTNLFEAGKEVVKSRIPIHGSETSTTDAIAEINELIQYLEDLLIIERRSLS